MGVVLNRTYFASPYPQRESWTAYTQVDMTSNWNLWMKTFQKLGFLLPCLWPPPPEWCPCTFPCACVDQKKNSDCFCHPRCTVIFLEHVRFLIFLYFRVTGCTMNALCDSLSEAYDQKPVLDAGHWDFTSSQIVRDLLSDQFVYSRGNVTGKLMTLTLSP